MSESFLHFVWQHQLVDATKLVTTRNEPIQVISIGSYNTNAGPDFLHAKIKIGETLWVGDIEIHIKSSDWLKHNHQHQKTYNSVILHVVDTYDGNVHTECGAMLPTLVLPTLPHVIDNHRLMLHNSNTIKCSSQLGLINSFYQNMWFDRLVIERFESKTIHFIALLTQNNNSWEESLYQSLGRSFGFNINTEAFESLARSLPLKIIAKHKNSLFQLEALLFGQAGLLSDSFNEEYPQKLQAEYIYLQKKYHLQPISPQLWKYARMRPSNFPDIRIAQFAQILYSSHFLTSKILETETIQKLFSYFSIATHEYWDYHYRLDEMSIFKNKQLGIRSIHSILINAIIPFLFAYGEFHTKQEFKQRAFEFLEQLPSEKNTIVNLWEQHSIQSLSAFRSQALLQLYKEYCLKSKCIQCQFGQKMIGFTEKVSTLEE